MACLKCKQDICECHICFNVTVLCVKIIDTCSCWTLNKCIKVCDKLQHCVDNLEICVFTGDNIKTDYIITANEYEQNKVFLIQLQLCNICDDLLYINKITTFVQEKRKDDYCNNQWITIEEVVNKDNIDICVDECKNILITSGISSNYINSEYNYRGLIKIYSNDGVKIIIVPLIGFNKNLINSNNWEVYDNDSIITTINETSNIDYCNNIYGPIPSCKYPCNTPIKNTAFLKLLNKCPCSNKHDIITSNTTSIIPKCSNLIVNLCASLSCPNTDQWCLCKFAEELICKNNLLGHYILKANVSNIKCNNCILEWNFNINIDCLSYKKIFKYSIIYDDIIIAKGTFILSKDKLTFNLCGVYNIQKNNIEQKIKLIIIPTVDTYDISNCNVEIGEIGSEIIVCNMVNIKSSDINVFLKDNFNCEIEYKLIDKNIIDKYENCNVKLPSRNGINSVQITEEINKILTTGVTITKYEPLVIYDFYIVFMQPLPNKIANTSELIVSNNNIITSESKYTKEILNILK